MNHELPTPPDYPFPETTQDPELLRKIKEYADAVHERNIALDKVGWQGDGGYFAGSTAVTFQRRANKITIDPEEAISKLGVVDEEGDLLLGFSVAMSKGQLTIGYNGPTDDRYFDAMDRLIQWGQEISTREENATIQQRAAHLIHRLGIVR